MPFSPARAKLTIGSLDDPQLEVSAQYNPKEIELQRSVGWKAHNTHNVPHHRRTSSNDDDNDLEFTGGEGRSLSIEMLFDGFETNTSIEPQMEALDEMATIRQGDFERRPHQCVVVWGSKGIKPLLCVIDSLSVKYTMFDTDGRPVRGVANVKVREASVSKVEYERLDDQMDRPRTKRAKTWAERQMTRPTKA